MQLPSYLKQSWPTTRELPRQPFTGPLVVTTLEKVPYRGWCIDVSEGGLGATVAAVFHRKQEVLLEFLLPTHAEPLKVRALVRYSREFHYGFEFVTLSPAQREAIRKYLAATPQPCKPPAKLVPAALPV